MDNQKNTAWNMTAMNDGTILVNTQDGEEFEICNALSPDDALGEIEWVLEQSCICNECREKEATLSQDDWNYHIRNASLDAKDIASGSVDDSEHIALTESGYYKFLMQLSAPIGQEFVNWICRTVVPTLRRSGKYEFSNASMDEMPNLLFEFMEHIDPIGNRQTQLDLPLKAESN